MRHTLSFLFETPEAQAAGWQNWVETVQSTTPTTNIIIRPDTSIVEGGIANTVGSASVLIYSVLGFFAVIMIFYGAIKYILNAYSDGQAAKGKAIIQNALWGLVFALFLIPILKNTTYFAQFIGRADMPNNGSGIYTFIETFIDALKRYIFPFIGPLAVLGIIYLGVRYMLSLGDDSKLEAVKKQIVYTLIGIFFLTFGYAIVQLLTSLSFS